MGLQDLRVTRRYCIVLLVSQSYVASDLRVHTYGNKSIRPRRHTKPAPSLRPLVGKRVRQITPLRVAEYSWIIAARGAGLTFARKRLQILHLSFTHFLFFIFIYFVYLLRRAGGRSSTCARTTPTARCASRSGPPRLA